LKNILLSFSVVFITFFASAQSSLVKLWDARFGGFKNEYTYDLTLTSDGGFLISGFTDSDSSADITQQSRDTATEDMDGTLHGDFWIVKTDGAGNMQWNKRYGGDKGDYLFSSIQTPDQGFLLAGSSYSTSGGDCTEPNRGSTITEDYWIVKTDASGMKQWDKRFGGNSGDRCTSVLLTSTGNYLLAGYSYSPVSGDKTQPQINNSSDYWIVKVNSSGTKIWDKVFGGLQVESVPVVIRECPDGGFAMAGISWSGAGADKTDTLHDTLTTSVGFRGDYWLVKIDSSGNKLWDRTFGGASVDWFGDMIVTSDGGLLLGGQTWSQLSGDVSEASRDTSLSWMQQGDFWIVKTDASGNKQWDKRFGGENIEFFNSVQQTQDGGYLLAGASLSGIGGDKSEAASGADTWLVKTDSLGIKLWDKTIYNQSSYHEHALMNADGCIVISTSTTSGIGGDVSQANKDTSGLNQTMDYWLAEFCDSAMVSAANENFDSGIKIFPNPASSGLTISSPQHIITSIQIFNTIGGGLMTVHFPTAIPKAIAGKLPTELDVSSLLPGIYILKIASAEKNFFAKFIKQ